jgi:hypothetical protein
MLVDHVEWALDRAQCFESKIDCPLHETKGMTGAKTRHFYNNLCSLEPLRYLEVGSYTGSSLCAALYKNPHVNAWAYDNFSEFNGPVDQFHSNIQKYIPDANLNFKQEDFFSANLSELKNKIDVYLYDGPHERGFHQKGIVKAWPTLAPQSVILIDDWNWSWVREGTYQGFLDVGARVSKTWEIRHTWDDTHTPEGTRESEFWNGIGIFIIDKELARLPCI